MSGNDLQAGDGKRDAIWVRILYMIGFGVIAWIMFGLILLLALLQLVVYLINKERNAELDTYCSKAIDYLSHLLGYVAMCRDDKPFPFGGGGQSGQSY